MQLITTNIAIADYIDMFSRKEVRINQDYQRNDDLWTKNAKSYFIETILLNYPMPKVTLHQILDLKTKKLYKEIVDGQQRSEAIREFAAGTLVLTKNIERDEFKGCGLQDLDADIQAIFLNYALPVDLLTGAISREVRSVFRRINSYTAPLNYEERRHASYQGEFKWFVHNLSSDLEGLFEKLGVFTDKTFARMQDIKLVAEIADAYLNGIRTTKNEHLESLYKTYDKRFPKKSEVEIRIKWAAAEIDKLNVVADTALAKPYMFYSLMLALIHKRYHIEKLAKVFEFKAYGKVDLDHARVELGKLAEALEDPDNNPKLENFIDAGGSNVKEKRETRFKTFCRALG